MEQQSFNAVALLGLTIGSDAILMQEAHGQAALCKPGRNVELPSNIPHADRDILIKWGVQFGERVQNDPIFTHATLPTGWSIKRTDHSMWSNLVDDRGIVRGKIFYKAAFYDRRANMRVAERYQIEVQYQCPAIGEQRSVTLTDTDTGAVLFTGSQAVPDPVWESDPHALAVEWLKQNRPGWNINRGWNL